MRIWISDATSGGTHGDLIKSAISTGYGSDISAQINLVKAATYSTDQVKADMLLAYNAGYELFVQSGFGGNNFINEAKLYYPKMLCTSPNGTNTHQSNGSYSIPELQIIVGGGDSANENGYPIEFFDNDPTGSDPDASSFANGLIAGKLLKIKDSRNCSWFEAVQCARATASLADSYSNENGYGIINVTNAINYTGTIQLSAGTLTAQKLGNVVTLTLTKINNALNYEIQAEKLNLTPQIENFGTTSLTANYTITPGTWRFRYRGITDKYIGNWSPWLEVLANTINYIIIEE